MPDDSSGANGFQIVFLVDSNPSFWGRCSKAEYAGNTIRLCVLKLLNYFFNVVKGKQTTLRWGYKFFVSNSLSHHFERHEFKEFSVSAFEEFENLVLKKFDESFRRHDEQEQEITVQENIDRDYDELSNSKKPPLGAKCVSCALTNTVHDFQWIKPDISSPVKIKSRGNVVSGYGNREGTRNIVFMLSGCPCDDVSISSFIGEHTATPDSLKNMMMPPVLFKEFKERCNIHLFWVNIGAFQQNTSLISLLDDFLKQLGGCLIPISSLVFTGELLSQPLPSDNGADFYTNKELTCQGLAFCGSVLPFKSVMDFYLCQTKSKAYDACNVHRCIRNSQGFNEYSGWLCSTGGGDKIHCAVMLNSMFNASSFQASEENPPPKEKETVRISPNLLWIRGVVKHSLVCPSWLHPMKVYSCVGIGGSSTTTDQKDPDQSSATFFPAGNLSGWFQELLLSLGKESKLLILDFADPDSGAPVTGILQPLTSVCGVISILSSAFLLTFEKLLCWNGKAPLKNNSSEKTAGHSSQGVSFQGQTSATGAIGKAVKPEGKEIFLSLPGSWNFLSGQTVVGLKQFEAGFLDPWCCFSDAIEQESICGELLRATESEDEDSENEAALMKELKDLYDKQHLTSGSTASRQRQTPKKTAKNKLQTTTRSSPRLRCQVDQKTIEDNSVADVHITGSETLQEKDLCGNLNVIQEGEIGDGARVQHSTPCQIKDKTQLISIIHDMYNKVILEGETLAQDLTSIVELVAKFFQSKQEEKECVSQFLEEHLVLPITRLRERYEGSETVTSQEERFRQYQLQILLRHEIADMTKADESSPLAEEVIVMLRAISFMKDPNFLSVYLREVLLQRYKSRIPRFLCAVYEGLMMRPPREVLSPSKWSSDDESPVRRPPVESHSSIRQDSNQPRSNGCRVLTRHTSVTELPGKRREIVVPGKAKPKAGTKKKEKQKGVNKREEKDARGQKTPVKQVRRNLFTEAEGSNENGSATGVPRKRKASDWGRKDERRRKFRRRNTIASFSSTTVQETPAHKQVSNALWCKQDRARKRSQALTDAVQVLQESPLKEIQAGEVLPRRSPRRLPGMRFQRSQSFYRSSSSTGPLTRTKSFTATGTRDSPKKGFLDGSLFPSSKGASLEKGTQGGILSPLRFSPRHKKKFSLHSLLTTAKECVPGEHSKSSYRKPATPKATRSSPRILKARSSSCIGFSSVPFENYHGNEERVSASHAEPRRNAGRCKTPVKENVEPAAVLPETVLRTPKNENPGKGFLETRMITPKSKNRLEERRTPAKHLQMDDCVVYLTPIKKSLVSPNRLSPELRGAATCVGDHTQPRVTGELEPALFSDPACSDDKSNVEIPVNSAVGPRLRCSTRLQGKLKEAVPSIEESGECCHNVAVPAVETVLSPISTVKLKTPTKINSFDDCVVLLTPMKHTMTSPKRVSSEGKRGLAMCRNNASQRDEESIMRTVEISDNCCPIGRLMVSPLSPPRFSENSEQEPGQGSPQPTSPDLNPSEKRPKSSSLKFKKRSRPVKSFTSPSRGTKNAFFDQTSPAGVFPGEEVRDKVEAAPHFDWIFKSDHRQKAIDSNVDSLVVDPANTSVTMRDVALIGTGGSSAGSQLPRNQRVPHSTPPPKKTKKNHGVPRSPAETKRASPLNQILRQQKRKRDFPSPPAEKCTRAFHASPRARNAKPTPLPQGSRNPKEFAPRAVIENNTSRSSEDDEDWLREMENEFERSAANYNDGGCNPPPSAKKRRLHKSVVFGKKTTLKKTSKKCNHKNSSSMSSDTSFEDDDEVFQSPAVLASRIKKWRLNRTPLSASSIKVLQESPILLDSKLPASPSSLTRKWSDLLSSTENKNQKARLRRRFPSESDSNQANAIDAFAVDDEEPIGFHLRKRLKLGTS